MAAPIIGLGDLLDTQFEEANGDVVKFWSTDPADHDTGRSSFRDTDNGNLQSVTVEITNAGDGDELVFVGIDGNYKSLDELTATDLTDIGITAFELEDLWVTPTSITIEDNEGAAKSVDDFAEFLNALRYVHTSDNPPQTPRQIRIVAVDDEVANGVPEAAIETQVITVLAQNDAPEISGDDALAAATFILNEDDIEATLDFTGISLSDVDGQPGEIFELEVRLDTGLNGVYNPAPTGIPSGDLSATSSGGVTANVNGSEILVLTGTLEDLEAFIQAGNVKFTPGPDRYTGGPAGQNMTNALNVQLELRDDAGGGDGGVLSATSAEIPLIVNPVNDAPDNTVEFNPDGGTHLEDTQDIPLNLSSIVLNDIDDDDVTVTLKASEGTLTANAGAGLVIDGSGTAEVSIAGSLSDVNAYLANSNLSYTPTLNDNGSPAATIDVSVTDAGESTPAAGDEITVQLGTIEINLTPVNDAPVIVGDLVDDAFPDTAPNPQPRQFEVAEDTPTLLDLSEFGFSDTDGQPGEIYTLRINLSDDRASRGDPLGPNAGNITLVDTDPDNGIVTIVNGQEQAAGVFEADETGFIQIKGTISDLQAFIQGGTPDSGIFYTSAPDAFTGNTVGPATPADLGITLALFDNGGGGIDPGLSDGPNAEADSTVYMPITVTNVNDAPTNANPGAYPDVVHDTEGGTPTINLSSVRIVDPDDTNVTLTLSVNAGTIRARPAGDDAAGTGTPEFAASRVVITGSETGTVTISGTKFQVNSYLDQVGNRLDYVPVDNDVNGDVAMLSVSVADDEASTDLGDITINLRPVNDAPVVGFETADAPEFVFTEGDPPLNIGNQIAITDVDSDNLTMIDVVIVNYKNGDELAVTEMNGITSSFEVLVDDNDTPSDASDDFEVGRLRLTSDSPLPLADYQAVLDTLTIYNGRENFSGQTRDILVRVTDEDANGNNDLMTRLRFDVEMVRVNDAPTVNASTVTEKTYFESEDPLLLVDDDDERIVLDDVDNRNLLRVEIEILNPVAGEDRLTIAGNLPPGIEIVRDVLEPDTKFVIQGSNGDLKSIAEFEDAINALQYQNLNDDNPVEGVRQIRITAVDPAGAPSTEFDQIVTVDVVGVDDSARARLPGGGEMVATEEEVEAGFSVLGRGLEIVDVDDDGDQELQVTIRIGNDPSETVIATAGDSGVEVTGNIVGDTITLLGTRDAINAYLAGETTGTMLFFDDDDAPQGDIDEEIVVTVDDLDGDNPTGRVFDLSVRPDNDAPEIEIGDPTFFEGRPVLVDVEIRDPDSQQLIAVLVDIQSGFAEGDMLAVATNDPRIASHYIASQGVLVLVALPPEELENPPPEPSVFDFFQIAAFIDGTGPLPEFFQHAGSFECMAEIERFNEVLKSLTFDTTASSEELRTFEVKALDPGMEIQEDTTLNTLQQVPVGPYINGLDVEIGEARGSIFFGEIGEGDDTVTGNAGDNQLDGLGGDDLVNGLAGDDTILASEGDDTFDGGSENSGEGSGDTVDYSGSDGRIDANLETGVAQGLDLVGFADLDGRIVTPTVPENNGTDELINIENIIGTEVDDQRQISDTLIGNEKNNTLVGLGGVDYIDGKEGDDTLLGGNGADVIIGGPGDDNIDGGADGLPVVPSNPFNDVPGTLTGDWVVYKGTGPLVVDLMAGLAESEDEGDDQLSNIENVFGSFGDNVLIGDGNNNQLFGRDGVDEIIGNGGDDILSGGGGDDEIDGGADNDTALYAGTDTDYTVTDLGGGNYTVTDNNAADGDEGTDTLTSIESIVFANHAPTGTPTAVLPSGIEDVVYLVAASDLLAGFTDPDGDDLSVANLGASVGTVIDNGNDTFTIGLPSGFNGGVTLTYDVIDGRGGMLGGQTSAFNVDPQNDACHDFNGDGTSDILWFNPMTRAVGQFEMHDGAPTWHGIGRAGTNWEAVGSGDFNGDGTSDILWVNAANGTVGQFEMHDGAASWQYIGTVDANLEAVGAGDFNGDGTDDILWFNAATGSAGQFEMHDGAATWRDIGTAGPGLEAVGSGDFNGDGTDDILWFNAATGAVGQFEMHDGTPTWRDIGMAGPGWEVVGSGDFNGDGTDDILWFNAGTGAVGQFEMNDGAATWRAIGRSGNSNWEAVGSGDYNGDGTDDILWFNEVTGAVGQYQMNDGVASWQGIGNAGDDWEVIA